MKISSLSHVSLLPSLTQHMDIKGQEAVVYGLIINELSLSIHLSTIFHTHYGLWPPPTIGKCPLKPILTSQKHAFDTFFKYIIWRFQDSDIMLGLLLK